MACSAATRRSVVSAASNPLRRAPTASSWWNGVRKRRNPSTVWLRDSPSDAAISPYCARGCGGRLEVVLGRLRLRRVEVLEEAGGEQMAAFPEQHPLLVGQVEDPGQLRRRVATRSPIRARDPARSEAGPTDGRAASTIRREESLERSPREPPVATRRGEDPDPARVAPAPQRRRRDAEDATGLREADPIGVVGRRASHRESTQIYADVVDSLTLARLAAFAATRATSAFRRLAAVPDYAVTVLACPDEGSTSMTSPHDAAPDRYDTMAYRRVGSSGLHLPAISLGLWQNFGDDRPLATQRAIVLRAFDRGVTHFDLANNYGPPPGSAETNFGQILRSDLRGYRDELVISTKAGYDMWPGPVRRPRIAQVPSRQPRPEPRPDGSRLRRHLLFPPRRSGHASGRDDGCSRQRRPPGQGALRGDLLVFGGTDARGRGDPARSRDAAAHPSAVLLDAEPLDRGPISSTSWGRNGSAPSRSRPWRRACSPTATSPACRRARA